MQVYLPDDLYAQVKALGKDFNVSGILQHALQERIDHEHRLTAGREALADYQAEHGQLTKSELADQAETDLSNSIYPQPKKQTKRAA